MKYWSFEIGNLPCMKRIILLIHPFPLSWFQIHFFSLCMIFIPGDEWLALIWCQMKNEIMIVSCSTTKLDWFPIIADIDFDDIEIKSLILRMTFCWTCVFSYFSETEKYLFRIEIIGIASTITIFEIQWPDSLQLTAIDSTYLKILNLWRLLLLFTCFLSFPPPITRNSPFKVAPHDL